MYKTIALTGGEQEVKFAGRHQYYHVHNLGGGEVLASLQPGVARGADGVLIVQSGGAGYLQVDMATDTVYLAGTGEALIAGTGNAFPPSFNSGAKGGGEITSKGGAVMGTVDYPLVALDMYGKSVQDGTPTPDAPIPIESVGDDGAVEVTACGKNLLPSAEKSTISKNGVNVECMGDGIYHITGTATKSSKITFQLKNSLTILDEPLYWSTNNSKAYDDIGLAVTLQEESTSNLLVAYQLDVGYRTVIYTNFSGRTINYVGFIVQPDIVYDETIKLQIEPNSFSEFEPYTASTATITSGLPLCSVGEYRDELIYNADGTGKIIKRIRKVVFNGSENWNKTTTTNEKNRLTLNIENDKCLYGNDYTPQTISMVASNQYSAISYRQVSDGNEGIALHHVTGNFLSLYDEDFSTLTIEEWKTHLAQNPLTVLYVLNTPQEIELSASEMAELMKLQTFDGVTNIYNDEGAEMTVKVATNPMLSEYVKPVIDGLITNYEARIAALEAAIVSNN